MTDFEEQTRIIAEILKLAGWRDTADAQWSGLQQLIEDGTLLDAPQGLD